MAPAPSLACHASPVRAPPAHLGHPWQGVSRRCPHSCRGRVPPQSSSPGLPLGPAAPRRPRRRWLPGLLLPSKACPRRQPGSRGSLPSSAGQMRGEGMGGSAVGRAALLVSSVPTPAPLGRQPPHPEPRHWPLATSRPPVLAGTPRSPPPASADQHHVPTTGTAAEATFSVLFKKKPTSLFRRTGGKGAGQWHWALSPSPAPALPPALRCGREGLQAVLQTDTLTKGAKSREMGTADPTSQPTSLETIAGLHPLGLVFSSSKGTVLLASVPLCPQQG